MSIRIHFLKECLAFSGFMFQAEVNGSRTESAIVKEAFGAPLKAFEFPRIAQKKSWSLVFKMGYVSILLSVPPESKAPVYGCKEILSTCECRSSPNLPFGHKI